MIPGGLEKCELCPRRCGVDRFSGERGFCGAGDKVEIFRYAPHNGEEPPISGSRGSGTVFFSRCTLRCVYCQNYRWSQEESGDVYGGDELFNVFRSLYDAGCHNWNLVSPTPWLPMIRDVLASLKKDGFLLPVVYNTSGFERVEVLEEYREAGDIFLTDLRYSKEQTGLDGSGCSSYVKAARTALECMFRLAGPLKTDADGVAVSGTICRILILPGRAGEAVDSLRWISEKFGDGVAVSVMSQYIPVFKATGKEGWNRRITEAEYEMVAGELEKLGLAGGWIQEIGEDTDSDLLGFQMKEGAFKA